MIYVVGYVRLQPINTTFSIDGGQRSTWSDSLYGAPTVYNVSVYTVHGLDPTINQFEQLDSGRFPAGSERPGL